MSPEAEIALYALSASIFAGLVTAGNYFVQKYLDKDRRLYFPQPDNDIYLTTF